MQKHPSYYVPGRRARSPLLLYYVSALRYAVGSLTLACAPLPHSRTSVRTPLLPTASVSCAIAAVIVAVVVGVPRCSRPEKAISARCRSDVDMTNGWLL